MTFANAGSCFVGYLVKAVSSQGAGGILACLAGLGGCWVGNITIPLMETAPAISQHSFAYVASPIFSNYEAQIHTV